MNRRRKLRCNRFGFQQLESRRVLSAVSPVDTLFVDDDFVSDDPVAGEYDTIQEAVDAANKNDRIMVAEGTYNEAVKIDDTKDGLELRSRKPLEAVIEAPDDTEVATVHIDSANDVQLVGFTIHGTPGIEAAVFVGGGDGGSVDILKNHIAVRDGTLLTGAQDGLGVLVGQSSALPGGTATATISNNLIDNYQKGGIVVNGAGSSAEITHNEVVGTPSVQGQAAQNGIQVSGGADAIISHNVVANNSYTPDPTAIQWAATGILAFQAGDVEISHNTVSGSEGAQDNNVGIYVYGTDDVEVSHNKLRDNDYGIILFGLEDALVEHNDIQDSDLYGILAYDVANSDFLHNRAKNSGISDFADFYGDNNNWFKNKGDLA